MEEKFRQDDSRAIDPWKPKNESLLVLEHGLASNPGTQDALSDHLALQCKAPETQASSVSLNVRKYAKENRLRPIRMD